MDDLRADPVVMFQHRLNPWFVPFSCFIFLIFFLGFNYSFVSFYQLLLPFMDGVKTLGLLSSSLDVVVTWPSYMQLGV